MYKPVLSCALALACAPVMAQVYKCPDESGRTVIQQIPCAGGEVLNIRPASGRDAPATAPDATDDMANDAAEAAPVARTRAEEIEAKTQASMRERRRRHLERRLVPDARAAIYDHRDQCARTEAALADDQYAYVQNLYGKTHAAQRASERAAVATRCDTEDRVRVDEFRQLLAECQALQGCAGIRE